MVCCCALHCAGGRFFTKCRLHLWIVAVMTSLPSQSIELRAADSAPPAAPTVNVAVSLPSKPAAAQSTGVWRASFCAFCSSFGSMCVGLGLGLTAPISALSTPTVTPCIPQAFVYDCGRPLPQDTCDITATSPSDLFPLFAGIMSLGGFLGGIGMEPISSRLGRRVASITTGVIFIAGSLLMGLTDNVFLVLFGRFLFGVAQGASASVVPCYIGETAPAAVRGRLGSINQLMRVTGVLIASCMGLAIVNNLQFWRWIAMAPVIPGSLLVISHVLFVPESPRWSLFTGNPIERVRSQMVTLYGKDYNIDGQLAILQKAFAASKAVKPASVWSLITDGSARYILAIMLLLQFGQRATGVASILYFSGTRSSSFHICAMHRLLFFFLRCHCSPVCRHLFQSYQPSK